MKVDVVPEAPGVIKTSLNTEFKYHMNHISNNEKDQDYSEKCDFPVFTGLE